MKKENQELNAIFAVAEEIAENKGEDSYYYSADDKFIIASFDGCGGSGAKIYENYSGNSGAYIASRAVSGGVMDWFCESGKGDEVFKYISNALSVCKKYADKAGRITGTLRKDFPTTVAIITGMPQKNSVEAECFWAGDSRCYMLNEKGLHQLSVDDIEGQDAMSNLVNDGVMKNVANASTPFEINRKKVTVKFPCIFLTATDGCFGYLKSPMAFEHLLIDSLMKADSMLQWKINLNEQMNSVSGDDYTLCVAILGFTDFESIKKYFSERYRFILNKYINNDADVNSLWEIYKKEYSSYIQ